MEIRLESTESEIKIESGDVLILTTGRCLQFMDDRLNEYFPIRVIDLNSGKITNGEASWEAVWINHHREIKEVIKFKDLILTRKDVE